MNREIKFRGKNRDIGWVFGQLAYGLNGETYIIEEVELDNSYGLEETILYPVMWHRVDPETIGQFTGLYDNTKKEIYEGDIVKDLEYKIIGKIEYIEYMTGYFLVYGKSKCISSICEVEVIGNEFDNPELLGGMNGI